MDSATDSKMFGIPVVLCVECQHYSFTEGRLFRLEPDLAGATKISSYANLSKPGWHTIDFGFLAYVVVCELNQRFVFPGLAPIGTKLKNKHRSVIQKFTKTDIENHIRGVLNFQTVSRKIVQDEFDVLVHDLRQLSTSIYHAAEEAKEELKNKKYKPVFDRIDNIIGSQNMLKIRTDLLNYSGNPIDGGDASLVPIFRRVDKVVRCFQPHASSKKVTITLDGKSHSQSFGPNVFEIVPYVILDNAIKYSPHNSEIEVEICEDEKSIFFICKSMGPRIEQSELQRIFDKGYRGRGASKSGTTGSGIGLYVANQLIRQFKGEISAHVGSEEIESSAGGISEVTFTTTIPISGPSA